MRTNAMLSVGSRLVLLGISTALVIACGSTQPTDLVQTETEHETASPSDEQGDQPTFPDGGPIVGTYELTNSGGTTFDVEIREDGIVAFDTPDGQRLGTWRVNEMGAYCSTPKGGDEVCYLEEIDENGVWTSAPINDPSDKSIIVRTMP